MFPYIASNAGCHFPMEVLSVRLQKEFRFRLREEQGLENIFVRTVLRGWLAKPEFS